MKRRVRRVLIAAAIVLGLGGIVAWIVGGQLVTPRPAEIGSGPDDLPIVAISLTSESGAKLSGWHIPNDDEQGENRRGVIVLLHPIRGSRLTMLPRARWLHSVGYSIVMIDLQAHGESTGEQITLGHLESRDARRAVEFARASHPNEPIGVLGVSLGGASSLLASPLDIDALILESVYPTIEQAIHNRVAAQLGPLASIPSKLLLWQLQPRLGIDPSNLRPIDRIAAVGCPVFIMSGADDEHTTVAETRAMFRLAKEPKDLWIVDGAQHVDLCGAATNAYKKRVLNFLATHMH
jgi:fermentation-respiration switch protein FrsA (DUF1100 family)